MPRKPIIRSNEHYYHLTGRSNNKEHFFLSKESVWRIMTFQLRLLQIEYGLKIAAFVLMDNHFHLLLLTPSEDIDRVMYFFMKRVTLRIQKESGRINKIFGGRYRGCLIRDESYLFNAYKYIYRNPIRAGLSERIEQYQFSSWKSLYIETEILFFKNKWSEAELKWLNRDFSQAQATGIKFSLRKSQFEPSQRLRSEEIFTSLP